MAGRTRVWKSSRDVKYFSTGILPLDIALGGKGWPFGRIVILGGPESAGKTELATQACVSVANYSHKTKQRMKSTDSPKDRGVALYVDVEGTLDKEWMELKGFDFEHHVIVLTDTSEQAIDIIDEALEQDCFDLIVLDSLAALAPSKEIESSVDEWQMGLAARLNNKAFRKWGSRQTTLNQSGKSPATIMVINQMREKLGVVYGDPYVLPGGAAQKYSASVIVRLSPSHLKDSSTAKGNLFSEISGVIHKSKMFPAKAAFHFEMFLKSCSKHGISKGRIHNEKLLTSLALEWEVIKKVGASYEWKNRKFSTQTEIRSAFFKETDLANAIWDEILLHERGELR